MRLFVLAAEKLNISAAGRVLGMAPAIASARLAKLENTLGADLLHRSTRKVALSLEGAEFLPFARDIIAKEDAALAALGKGNPIATGTLRFTAPSTFAQLYIAPVIHEFLAQFPEVTLDLRFSDSQYDLIDGSFDLALRNVALADSSMKGRKLAKDRRILCASPAYVAARGMPESVGDLLEHDLIAFGSGALRALTDGADRVGTFDFEQSRGRLVLDDGLSQKIATVAGAGISINSIWSVWHELNEGRLVRVLPDHYIDDNSALWLVYPQSNVLSPKVRVFIDFLVEKIGRTPVWERPISKG